MAEKERHLDICNCFVKHRESLIFTGGSACAARGIAKLNGFKTRPLFILEKSLEDQLRAIGYEVIRASWNDVIK